VRACGSSCPAPTCTCRFDGGSGVAHEGDLDLQVRVVPATFAAADAAIATVYARNLRSTHTPYFSAFEASGKPDLGVQLTVIDSPRIFWRVRDVLLARADLRAEYDALKQRHEGGCS
jgi:hypothetical protein